MKKLLVVLLSLGLIAAFCAPAAAVEVKLGGEWYTYGIYYANRTLVDEDQATSRAWIYTQTRLAPTIQVADGLKLTMRADMLSKFWGGTNWRGGTDDKTSSRKQVDAQTGALADTKIQENIEIERAFVTADLPYGQLGVGYMSSGTFGTDFANDGQTRPRIRFVTKVGPVSLIGIYEKTFESDHSNNNAVLGQYTDADNQNYNLAGVFEFEGGEAGLLLKYVTMNSDRPVPVFGGKGKLFIVDPYVTMSVGPVEIEAEFAYMNGSYEFDDSSVAAGPDQDAKGWGGMVKAKLNLGPAYVGGMFLYSSGDDDPNDNTDETGPASPDASYGYIMLKDYEDSDVNPVSATGAFEADDALSNIQYYQLYAGFDPTEKLNVQAQLLYARANEVPANWESETIGTEFGVEATYKIFDNLSYKVAAAYMWAGDIFKENVPAYTTGNDYMLYNKLTLEW